MLVIILHNLAVIPFAMTLSTFFNDSKVGSSMGYLILIIPMIICIWLIQDGNPLIYYFYWIPIFPTSRLLINLTTPHFLEDSKITFHCSNLSVPAAWIVLALLIPLWFMAFLYFESVMPSENGIQKHPLFCFRKKHRVESDPKEELS